MDFIDRLKQAYENGKDSGFLDLKYSFYAMMLVERPRIPHPNRFLSDLLSATFDISKEKAKISRPKGFLEELAYNFGKNPVKFLSPF